MLASHPHAAGAAAVGLGVALLALWTQATSANPSWTLFWSLLTVLLCGALVVRRLLPVEAEDDTPEETPARNEMSHAELWVFALVATAAALVAAAELIFLRDIFGTRMNTVFKLYFQAWLLLGIAAGPALVWLLPRAYAVFSTALADTVGILTPGAAMRPAGALALAGMGGISARSAAAPSTLPSSTRLFASASPPAPTQPAPGDALKAGAPERARGRGPEIPAALRWLGAGGMLLWMSVLAALVCAALVYPVLATSARTDNFNLPRGLDGTAYMASDPAPGIVGCQVAAGTNHDDNEAIAWLNANVQGSPVIVEAPGCEWSHYSRVSAFTGLPTLLGWPGGHEGEWRANWLTEYTQGDIFAQRQQDINTIYTSPDSSAVLAVLQRYHARYVYVGAAERALYPNADLSRFGGFLRVIYNRDGITIYETPF
jgi:hypothetical protein